MDGVRTTALGAISATVRQKLIHAWQYHEFGEADHGATFTRWTDTLDTMYHLRVVQDAELVDRLVGLWWATPALSAVERRETP